MEFILSLMIFFNWATQVDIHFRLFPIILVLNKNFLQNQ